MLDYVKDILSEDVRLRRPIVPHPLHILQAPYEGDNAGRPSDCRKHKKY